MLILVKMNGLRTYELVGVRLGPTKNAMMRRPVFRGNSATWHRVPSDITYWNGLVATLVLLTRPYVAKIQDISFGRLMCFTLFLYSNNKHY